jgi:hypothetical protein
MKKIEAYTYVTCPVGTTIELHQNIRPKIGQTFDVLHIDTKKVVNKARVLSVEDLSRKNPQPLLVYRISAKITK